MAEPLVTILTAPKPFVDPHIRIIQRNALRSWLALGSAVDVIVLGNDAGIQGTAQELGVRHFPSVECNDKGTPLLSSMLEIARQQSTAPFLAIVNADIILFDDFISAIQLLQSKMEEFLLVGQRWDMQVSEELIAADAFHQLRSQVTSSAVLHPPAGSDYFVFPRHCYQNIPPFAIGRAGWDNWFIFKSRFEGWKVIDGTERVTIVHQDHDYRHLPGGLPHYRLPETKQNVELAGGDHTIFTLFDAQYRFQGERVVRVQVTLKKILRELEIFPLTGLRSHFLGRCSYYLFNPRKGYHALRHWMARRIKKNSSDGL